MNHRSSLILFLIVSGLIVGISEAKKTRQHLPKVKNGLFIKDLDKIMPTDTITDSTVTDSLIISGYNKPKNSLRETFLIRNISTHPLLGMKLQLEYFNEEGDQIHKREVNVSCIVPAKETRMVEIPGWDRQQTYYYIKGQKPRTGGRAYDVRIEIKEAYFGIQ